MINNLYNIYPLTAELYIFSTVLLLLLFGVFFSNTYNFGYPILTTNLAWLSLQSLILSFLLMYSHLSIKLVILDSFLISDSFSWYLKTLILLFVIFWIIFSLSYSQYEKLNSFEY